MRLNQNIKFREAEKILLLNGFAFDKCRGSHHQYTRNGQRVVINLKLNACVWNRICKENHLIL